jgi:multicomponent Na+:H+ antiporter subunit C
VLGLLSAGGRAGDAPIVDGANADDISDPLPQALSLTAIVISFGLTLYLLALARRQQILTGDDLVEDDVEDRRIAAEREAVIARTDETLELEAQREGDSS